MTRAAADLEGKVALVTGAGSLRGIGVAAARVLASAGAHIVIADLAKSDIAGTAETLRAEGIDVVARTLDIAQEEQVRALFGWISETYGRLDIVDNNAANQANPTDMLVSDMDVELWDKIMGVNARGTMLMCKHALPLMIAGGGGSIINMSSGTSLAGDFFATAYACSKGAINTLTHYVATQYGQQGVRCNAIASGLIMTGALEGAMPLPMQEIFRGHSLTGQLGTPVDIAEMVGFLASPRARFVTGQIISVDGGIYAHIPTVPQVKALFDQG
jgi:NAD(P)-dependent dehydrogenase (short-subunit alcohol dehydrogenase family)